MRNKAVIPLLATVIFVMAVSVYARMPEQDINLAHAAELLSEKNARIFDKETVQTVPLNLGDTELQVAWKLGVNDDWPMLRAALELYTWPTHMLDGTKSRFVDDPVIHGTEYPGKWRQALIRRIRQETQDGYVYWIVLTLRSGYASSLSWDEARLVESDWSESTSTSASNISNTAGFDTAKHVVVRWMNISPFKVQTVMNSLTNETYTNVKVYGETLSGSWYNVMVSGGKSDDGSCYIDMLLSRSRFTMELYSNYGTANQSDIYKLFNVPKTIAQEIIDDWQGEGRSADATYSESTKYCTIVLADDQVNPVNLSTANVKNGCDQYVKYHFAWGYTETNLVLWINSHDGSGDTQPTSRRVSITQRQDGLFNGVIEERTFSALSTTQAQFTITMPIGTKITRQTDYGYNWNSTQMSSSSLMDSYNTNAAATGMSVDFRVTRQDDCSFDWVAVITKQTADILGTVDTGNAGVSVKGYAIRGANTNEIAEFESSIKTGPRTNVTLDISMQENELTDIKALMRVVQANTYSNDTGAAGVRNVYLAGVNVDGDDIPDVKSAARTSVGTKITPLDDGTYAYGISKTVVKSTETSKAIGDATVYAGRNADSVLGTSLIGKVMKAASIVPGDDGTVNYGITVGDLHTGITNMSGTVSNARHIQLGINQDSLPSAAAADLMSASWTLGDNGKLIYSIISTDVDKVDTSVSDSGSSGITLDVSTALNDTNPPSYTSTRLVRNDVDVTPLRNGRIAWTKKTRTLQESSGTWTGGSIGDSITESVANNQAGFTNGTPARGTSYELVFAGYDDAGNLQYRMRKRDKTKVETTITTGGSALHTVSIKAAAADDSASITGSTPSSGVSYFYTLNTAEDGSSAWIEKTVTAVATDSGSTVLAKVNPALRMYGYTETGKVFRNASSPPMSLGADEYGYYKRLVLNDDGTYDGEYAVITYTQSIAGLDSVYGVGSATTNTQYTKAWTYIYSTALGVQQKQYAYITLGYHVYYNTYTNFSAAAAAMSDADLSASSIRSATVGGKTYWMVKKVGAVPTSNSGWVTIGDKVDAK